MVHIGMHANVFAESPFGCILKSVLPHLRRNAQEEAAAGLYQRGEYGPISGLTTLCLELVNMGAVLAARNFRLEHRLRCKELLVPDCQLLIQ
jgi:hypothetical protein